MTRKDYRAIANALWSAHYYADSAAAAAAVANAARRIAEVMGGENPRFRPAQFFGACGLTARGESPRDLPAVQP